MQRANANGDAVAAYDAHLAPAVAFLNDMRAPSYPGRPAFANAQAVCAFLAHELERRVGTTKTLDAVCDALIVWALEDTDPDAGRFMTKDQILTKVEAVVPTARKFLPGAPGRWWRSIRKPWRPKPFGNSP